MATTAMSVPGRGRLRETGLDLPDDLTRSRVGRDRPLAARR